MLTYLAINTLKLRKINIVTTAGGNIVLTESLISRFHCFEYLQSAQKAYLFQFLLTDMFSFSCFVSIRN